MLSPIGDKFLVRWYRGYLITASEGSRVGGGRGAHPGKGGSRESKTLAIYDIQNQFVGELEILFLSYSIIFIFSISDNIPTSYC